MSYETICSDFLRSCRRGWLASSTTNKLQIAFDKAKEIDPVNGINSLFSIMLKEVCFTNSDHIHYMINLGADPKTINNIEAICTHLLDAPAKENNADVLHVLLDHGLSLEPEDIGRLVRRVKFIDVLIDKGIDLKTILEEIADNAAAEIDNNVDADFKPEIADFIIEQIKKIDFELEQWALAGLLMIVMYCKKLTVDIIELFINIGLEPKYNNDEIFVESCKSKDISTTQYLINNYCININAHDGEALVAALNKKNKDTVKLLLEHGIKITDQHIRLAIEQNDEFIEMLIEHGNVSHEQVARILVKKAFSYNKRIPKLLVENGVDFNQLIREV